MVSSEVAAAAAEAAAPAAAASVLISFSFLLLHFDLVSPGARGAKNPRVGVLTRFVSVFVFVLIFGFSNFDF